MFEKKFNIDGLYFVVLGIKKFKHEDAIKIVYRHEPINYICVKINNSDTKPYCNVLTKENYASFQNPLISSGDLCIGTKSIIPARRIFSDPRFKVIDKTIISGVANELFKPKEKRNFKEYFYRACRLNKIKVLHVKNKESEEVL